MRFTLVPHHWYACELIGGEFDEDRCSYSPIRIGSVRPQRTGKRTFALDFYHASYPEGVRDKTYQLETIERGERYILAKSIDHHPVRLLLIYEVDWSWLERHCTITPDRAMSVGSWLQEHA